jgi:histidyl-tRNA synthetase
VAEPQLQGAALNTTQRLRAELPGIRIRLHMGGSNFKKQLKKADASGARVAVLVGADSVAGDMLTIKHLRDAELGQETLAVSDGLARLQKSLA